MKTVVLRARADEDIDRAVEHYLCEAPDQVDFLLDDLESTIASIGRSPGIGSPRFAHELEIPGLRHRTMRRFPYLVFYLEGRDRIDVLRVLHQRRDIGETLLEQE